MTRTLALLALPVLALGCRMEPIEYRDEPATAPPPKAMYGTRLPDSQPIRELHTQCRDVTYQRIDDKGDVRTVLAGHLVVYLPLPAYDKNVERRYPEGTVLVEDPMFRLIGVFTPYGRGTKFDGVREIDLGRGTIDELLPKFYGKTGLVHAPIAP